MTSVCDPTNAIGSCAPHASQVDVIEFLTEFCKECYGEVPQYTDEVDFCSVAFGGSADANCEYLLVKRLVDDEFFISTDCVNWQQLTFENNVGYVPLTTLPEDFLITAWGSYADMPDPTYAPILFIVEDDCELWIAANDRTNCDLGTIPVTPGTGTDWVKITTTGVEHNKQIAGMEVNVIGNTIGTIGIGSCRDDTDNLDIGASVTLNFDCSAIGANGLDANDVALAINTWYYVYVIIGVAGIASFVSTSAVPVLPGGYSYKRRVGWARTDSSANFRQTVMMDGVVAYVYPIAPYVNAGIADQPAWTAFSFTTLVPQTARHMWVNWYMPAGAAPNVRMSIDGSTFWTVYFDLGGNHSGIWLFLSSGQIMWLQDFTIALAENFTIYVNGYKDDRSRYN